ncbi:NADH:flavin oxidoreductase/NADH oxidase [Gordonia humi]|uniref:2,4-dienoyl-CoA reductase-like NADH-dependent reductase (Old Yellow Enzyme family) n=1 Tax=Gordonia humi TaxID=686429 RepID=A0A840EYV9_9ACTN|nr:NADH:flavin oxidoreductase/NADH oxidase [Gordonia humi]MBB4134189.1 2,4-dienoyl-CoA reductase-like NADH-dependent reductase (Old Yellow Enzyme family) [Gordonia humi]
MSHLLFEPITLRGLTVRNRVWVPPMCQYSANTEDGVPAAWHLVHYGGLARGGAGAVIVEATGVTPEGRISNRDLGLWNDEQRDAFAPIVDFMHSQGAAAGIQLAHAGRKASTWPEWGAEKSGARSVDEGGWQTVAPSPIAFPDLADPKELTAAEIVETVAAFAASARRAADAGFDLVEIHAAHGYLLHEFLSPLSNVRTDSYGGSLENRARFLLETVDAVRAEVGDDFPVLVRLSATDWTDGGLTGDDTVEVSRLLKAHGVDLIDVSTGANVPAQIPVGPGYQVRFAEQIRSGAELPTAAVGLITDPFQAEQILATGQADVVLLGREMLRDPHFPVRAEKELRREYGYVPAAYHRAFA